MAVPGVDPGIVPAIHAAPPQETFEIGVVGSAWMPGTRPGMTRGGCTNLTSTRISCASSIPRTAVRQAGEGLRSAKRSEIQAKRNEASGFVFAAFRRWFAPKTKLAISWFC